MNKLIEMLEIIHSKRKMRTQEIVLVAEDMQPRVAKIGSALKKRKFKVILLLKLPDRDELEKLDKSFFSKVSFFKGKEDLYVKCLLFSPLIYHLFMEVTVDEWAEYLIRKKNILGKVVYDQYDIYRGFFTDTLDEIGKREKYCLENADGLCCRMFETQYLKHTYHYQFKGKRLLFLDYCWNDVDVDSKPEKDGTSLKFVYGGRLIPKPRTRTEGYRYKIELNGLTHIARTIQENQAYLAILPHRPCKGSDYSAYQRLGKKYSHIVIKDPMNYRKLIRYERHMDYGLDCLELNEDIERYSIQKNAFNMKAKNRYYATNKYFDYLDAGVMPIYGRKGELFGNYLARFGGAVWCSLEKLPDKMNELKMNREANRKKAHKAREIFAIENQIGRLIDFYKKI
ncbi:MAG: hypothetical protein HFI04_00315 [Lachnospiraceae bacterium]|jgi:hypothetical protein|nr:hypothetical protein [Lachnospiraceae bacterium]